MSSAVKHKLTYPLIAVLVIVCLVLAGYFSIDKMLSKPVVIKDVKIDTKAVLKLNILKQISKKNGIKEWELTAASATLLKRKTGLSSIRFKSPFIQKMIKKHFWFPTGGNWTQSLIT